MQGMIPSPKALDALERQLLGWLTRCQGGLSEHQLLKCLREDNPLFAEFTARDPLSLFRGHYLLFHTLYRLRDRLILERRGQLRIDPLRVILEPVGMETVWRCGQLDQRAPDIGFWYADPGRLLTVTAEDITQLLRQLNAIQRMGSDGRCAALAILELCDPVDDTTIKQQYRRLVMRYHPDRGGGDEQHLSTINAAFAVLIKKRCPAT
ncbi:MAG: molecular chaperone DnaJ [Candidatus Contendobacter odensis]|uniref:Molecular chaperone DnaJ n=1 Tax=Candidatus Contendibacter odensensis TaxID=1400860 RepID=A0A2G6PG88_9GAMM|nr:MAG: molecular chaperone DnaJ [Candidatus Contendobacter odensis]